MQTPYLIGGFVVIATLIVGGYFGYQYLNKPENAQNNQTNTVTTSKTTNYDGTYIGNTGVMAGLADVSVTVSGNNLNGKAKYVGSEAGYEVSVPVEIIGSVSSIGKVSAKISGSGEVVGQTFSVDGSSTGQITGNTMDCNYNVTAAGDNDSGKITLTK
jgi:hypothetical protein